MFFSDALSKHVHYPAAAGVTSSNDLERLRTSAAHRCRATLSLIRYRPVFYHVPQHSPAVRTPLETTIDVILCTSFRCRHEQSLGQNSHDSGSFHSFGRLLSLSVRASRVFQLDLRKQIVIAYPTTWSLAYIRRNVSTSPEKLPVWERDSMHISIVIDSNEA